MQATNAYATTDLPEIIRATVVLGLSWIEI